MNRAFRWARLFAVCGMCFVGMLAVTGCANTRGMALDAGPKAMNLTQESIGIFTLRTRNEFKPSYLPNVEMIYVTAKGSKKPVQFRVRGPYNKGDKESCEYLVSMKLAPGAYSVSDISGSSRKLLIYGVFAFPIGANFEMPANAVVYLGHVDMVNRKREEGERRSGPVIPLIDQSVSGYANSTFDVLIADNSDADISLFRRTYTCLGDCAITTAILKRE